jgi:hypothetical protein
MTDPIPMRPIRWDSLRADEAERVIRDRVSDTDNVIFGLHAFDRIDQRSITRQDVYWILETGHVEGQPERVGTEWKVTVVRRMPGSREAGVVTAFAREDKTIFVVTVEWMDWIR